MECLAEFYQKSYSTNGRLINDDWASFKEDSKYPEIDVNFIFKQLARTGFINEYHAVISFDGDDEDSDDLIADMNGTFQGYELDKSFLKFYDMVLNMDN